MSLSHHVVIVGGGFAGLRAARALAEAPARVTVIDRCNYHLFQPLLYQVATGSLSPANIAVPLREVLREQTNTRVLLGEVTGIDVAHKRVQVRDGELAYDTLILAAGAGHSYFGNEHWEALAPGLKTLHDATGIRERVLLALERAERCEDAEQVRRLLTFVVVGAGPTGVELAGSLAEFTRTTLRGNFRHIDPAMASIHLVEGAARVLPVYRETLSEHTRQVLGNLGVRVHTGTLVTDVQADHVILQHGDTTEKIDTSVVVWAAGVRASPLAARLAEAAGVALDRAGRVPVQPDLTLVGYPDVFVVGDVAHFAHQGGKPLPGVAPVAMRQGEHAADCIKRRLRGEASVAFRYSDRGSMATIGRGQAVLQMGRWWLTGYVAWVAWALVHLLQLVGFENRLLVLVQWLWHHATRRRSARLITQRPSPSMSRAGAARPDLLEPSTPVAKRDRGPAVSHALRSHS